MRSQRELENERKEDLERIVEAEALLLLLLRRRTGRALRSRKAAAERANLLFASVESSILEGRAVAAELSLERTREQLRGGLGHRFRSGEVSDAAVKRALAQGHRLHAERAAHGISNRFLTAELDEARAFKISTEIDRLASTEAVDAFRRSRDEYIDRLPDRIAADLHKVWQTAGDRNVCDICDPLDGARVTAREEFPQGDPPIHPFCRCSYTIYTTDELPS